MPRTSDPDPEGFYAALGLDRSADQEAIKKAGRLPPGLAEAAACLLYTSDAADE